MKVMDRREEFDREEVLSRSLKAGKRTYFFDVKQTRNDDKYLVITESKKLFNDSDGSFTYEKHKIFLYKEDYEKFAKMLNDIVTYMKEGIEPPAQEYPRRDFDTLGDNSFQY